MEIPSGNLKLVLQTPEALLASIEAMDPEDRAQVSPDWLARVMAATAPDPWMHGFSMVERESDIVVGSCGYKAPPDTDGVVEIAYQVGAEYRERGYATDAAKGLTSFAFTNDQVNRVRAHTLPSENASTRVLRKCGFELIGDVIDPEDGPVWRWELSKQE